MDLNLIIKNLMYFYQVFDWWKLKVFFYVRSLIRLSQILSQPNRICLLINVQKNKKTAIVLTKYKQDPIRISRFSNLQWNIRFYFSIRIQTEETINRKISGFRASPYILCPSDKNFIFELVTRVNTSDYTVCWIFLKCELF